MIFPSLRVVNVMAAIISMTDALSTGLMAASESRSIKALNSNRIDLMLMGIQLVALCREFGELII